MITRIRIWIAKKNKNSHRNIQAKGAWGTEEQCRKDT